MTSAMNWLAACACSPGGPGRNREEHSGGRSTLGTEQGSTEQQSVFDERLLAYYSVYFYKHY